ncbi:MAG: DUF4124 domain-containing protein [Enterobacterales bacterium]|nr:DUF4124 domain-containing protein [Enterobacterales bacterium]
MISSTKQFRGLLLLICTTWLVASFSLVAQQQEQQSKAPVSKKLYKMVDKNGKVYFSDQPQEGAKEIKAAPMQSIPMNLPNIDIVAPHDGPEQTRDANAGYYDSLGFLNLNDKDVIRNNGGVALLSVVLEPGLNVDHYLQLYVDGKAVSERQKSMQFQAKDITYGAHKTYFEVVTSSGMLIQRSPTIEFILLHTPRQQARVRNTATNNVYQIKLPTQPKVPSYDAMKKLISGSQKPKR